MSATLMDTVRPATADGMMTGLVMGNTDIVGLLAYSMYSQFREEWRAEFRKAFGRDPDAHELAVYEVGEHTARRKMTYRFLADARVIGTYADMPGSATQSFVQKAYESGARTLARKRRMPSGVSARTLAIGFALTLFFVAAFPYLVDLGRHRVMSLAASDGAGRMQNQP